MSAFNKQDGATLAGAALPDAWASTVDQGNLLAQS
jgi:hypothetical protein